MNNLIITSLFVLLGVAWARPDVNLDEFDHIDIDAVFTQPRLVDNYMLCAKTGQKCTPEGQKLRDLLPTALKSKCAECTQDQKDKVAKVLQWAIQNRKDDFLEIEEIFDPGHQYRADYESELSAHNIVLPPLK